MFNKIKSLKAFEIVYKIIMSPQSIEEKELFLKQLAIENTELLCLVAFFLEEVKKNHDLSQNLRSETNDQLATICR